MDLIYWKFRHVVKPFFYIRVVIAFAPKFKKKKKKKTRVA